MKKSSLWMRLARKKSAVIGRGLAIEEPFTRALVQEAAAKGTMYDFYYANLDLFNLFCHYSEHTKALEVLPNLIGTDLEPSDDCSNMVAESLIDSFNDFENAFTMVQSGYRSAGEIGEPAPTLYYRWKLKCLELRIYAHIRPESANVPQLFEEIQKYWTDEFDKNLLSAILCLRSKKSLPRNRKGLLIRIWAALAARQRFGGEEVATLMNQFAKML